MGKRSKKRQEEYVPQFEIGDTNFGSPQYCKICKKIDDTINDDGICYTCQKKLEIVKQANASKTKYSKLIDEHNSQIYDEMTMENTSVKNISNIFLILKIISLLSPVAIMIINILLGVLYDGTFLAFAIVIGIWAVIGFIKANTIFKNIIMLKHMELYELSKKAGANNRVILDEENFVITEKFIYSNSPWSVLPIEHISEIIIYRGTGKHMFYKYPIAKMISGECFTFRVVNIAHKEILNRYIDEILRVNPSIEIRDF